MKRSTEITCYESALAFLARRQHFRSELGRKLARRHAEEEIESTLERLAAEGLIDDLECARAFRDGPLRRKGYGPVRIRADLRRRGAAAEIAERVVDEAFAEGDLEVAVAAADAWRRRRPEEEADRTRLARHLERKGFTAGSIRAIVHGGPK